MRSEKFLGIVSPSNGGDPVDLALKVPHAVILKQIKSEHKEGDSANYSINLSLQCTASFCKSEMPINK